MEIADPYYVPKPLMRRDTTNLIVTAALLAVVVDHAVEHGWTYADVLYVVVLAALLARYALSRTGVLPMRVFELTQWYTLAFVVVFAGGFALTKRIPALQRPIDAPSAEKKKKKAAADAHHAAATHADGAKAAHDSDAPPHPAAPKSTTALITQGDAHGFGKPFA